MEKNVEYYPLTHPQKGIWYTEKLYPGTSIGVVAGTLKIRDNINYRLLEKAINTFVYKNDSLRLHFTEINGEPFQYLTNFNYKNIDFFDFSNKLESLFEWDTSQTKLPFDILDNDLFYFALLKVSDNEVGVYVKIHHLISDGWTFVHVGNEILEYYSEYKNGNLVDDIKRTSYIDYIKSETDYLSSPRFFEDQLFWNNQFKDIPDTISFKNKTNKDSTRAKRKTFIVPNRLALKIQDYSQKNRTSIFSLFLTALSMYLNRVTGMDNQIIGIPVLNRSNAKERKTSGMFINTIPFKICIDEDIDFKTFASNITKDWMTILRHQKYPYDLLKRDLHSKNKGLDNLYNIVLSYQNAQFTNKKGLIDHEGRWHFNGRQLEPLYIHINEREGDGDLIIDYDYLVDIFYSKEIEFIHEHILRLLWHGLDNPLKPISKLEIVSEKEKAKILCDFNDTLADFPQDTTIHQLFEAQVKKSPDNTAVVYEGNSISYYDLNQKANYIAGILRNKGVQANTIVGILIDRSIEMIIAILGILKSGGTYLPLDPSYPQNRLASLIIDSEPLILLTTKNLYNINLQLIESSRLDKDQIIEFDELLLHESNGNYNNLTNVNIPNDTAYIIYTSGSTGTPKGVMIQHKNVVRLLFNSKMQFEFNNKDVWTMFHSYCFDFSVWEMYGALLYGGKLIVVPRITAQDPLEFLKILINNKVTVLNQIPTAFYNLSNVESQRLEKDLNIRYVIFGGEALKPANLKIWKSRYPNTKLINMYGITETTVHVTYKEVTNDIINANTCNIGVPIPTLSIYILDKNKQLVPIGVKGEIYVGGEGVALGYLNRTELTNERFIDNPYKPGERIYRSGDAGRWYANGEIEYLGRLDYQVKIHGFRVELGEIESKIMSYKEIKDVVVLAKENECGDNSLTAYIVCDKSVNLSHLRNYLNSLLPQYMIPSNYVYLAKMPLTSNGKVDKKALQLIKHEHVAKSEYCPPRNKTEKMLVDIWEEVLRVDKIGIKDNFFELGGDSLSIIQVQVKSFNKNWGIKTQDYYSYPTIEQLYEMIINKQDKLNYLIQNDYTYDVKSILKSEEQIAFKNILLTGATGFLGIHILYTLLAETNAYIYCIVRKTNDTDSHKRIINDLNFYFNEFNSKYHDRIYVLEGDISKEYFGLNKTQYNRLSNIIDTIIHSAANVRHYGSNEEFENTNVTGTQEVIKFSEICGASFHHISTISISGNYIIGKNAEKATYTEEDYYIGQNVFDNVYLKTKLEAEKVVLEAAKRGIKVNIYRLGNITGRYSDGHFQKNISENAFYKRIKSILLIGAVSEQLENIEVDMTPVDYCSKAIVNLIKKGKINSIYHLYSRKLRIKELIKIMKELNIANIITLDDKQFRNHIISISGDAQKQQSLVGLINELNSAIGFDYEELITTSNKNTLDSLKSIGFTWPETNNRSYVKKIFDYMESVNFIEKEEITGAV